MTTRNDGRKIPPLPLANSTTPRQRAGEKARVTGDQDLEALSPEEARRLLHELREQQIELETQNKGAAAGSGRTGTHHRQECRPISLIWTRI